MEPLCFPVNPLPHGAAGLVGAQRPFTSKTGEPLGADRLSGSTATTTGCSAADEQQQRQQK